MARLALRIPSELEGYYPYDILFEEFGSSLFSENDAVFLLQVKLAIDPGSARDIVNLYRPKGGIYEPYPEDRVAEASLVVRHVGGLSENLQYGTCYEDAWRYVIKEEEGYLIHGTVLSAGKRIKHAWVETETGYIWEPGTREYFTPESFHIAASPVEEHRYTVEQAAILAARTNKMGPWTQEERSMWLKSSNPVKLPKVNDVLIVKVGVTPEEKLLRAIYGESLKEPKLTEEVICECGKYRHVRYVGIYCDRCGAVVKERKVLLLPEGWKIEEGKKWYREHGEEWEYRPGYGYVRRER